jgi:hypothetical protein
MVRHIMMAVNESSTIRIFFFRTELEGGPGRAVSSVRSASAARSAGGTRRSVSESRGDRGEDDGLELGGVGTRLLDGVLE